MSASLLLIFKSKADFTILTLALFILVSLGDNICQINKNGQLKDNDLKYLYIKSANGISQENLYKLEDIFHYHRDKKMILKTRINVAEYEKKISKKQK